MLGPSFLPVLSLLFSLDSSLARPWTPQGALLDIPQQVDKEARITSDENSCNVYYFLKTPMTCGTGMGFNKKTLRCESAESVAKQDPACAEELGVGGAGGGGADSGYGAPPGGGGKGGAKSAAGGYGAPSGADSGYGAPGGGQGAGAGYGAPGQEVGAGYGAPGRRGR